MKTPSPKELSTMLSDARTFMASTRQKVSDLEAEREDLDRQHTAIWKTPIFWSERGPQIAKAIIEDKAKDYVSSMLTWIQGKNPNLKKGAGYEDLPFLGIEPKLTALHPSVFSSDEDVTASALSYFFADVLERKLTALLLSFPPPTPEAECISEEDQRTQLAALDARIKAINEQIRGLNDQLESWSEAVR